MDTAKLVFMETIKSARLHSGYTVEQISEKIGITERYYYRIESEGCKPSFDVLYLLIRELNINPDTIFYPEKTRKKSEIEELSQMLYLCDDNSLRIIKATIKAVLECQRS